MNYLFFLVLYKITSDDEKKDKTMIIENVNFHAINHEEWRKIINDMWPHKIIFKNNKIKNLDHFFAELCVSEIDITE